MSVINPSTIEIRDEGTTQGHVRIINFAGAGVSAAVSAGVATATIGGGGSASISEVSIPFTDGDTMRRVTVTDAAIASSSKIIGTIRRPDTEDSADRGYIYSHSIIKVATGSFDLLISCLGWGFDDPTEIPPNETIKFYYMAA